jgi:ABC-type transport system involved in cytochrome c biogenesis permease subunit
VNDRSTATHDRAMIVAPCVAVGFAVVWMLVQMTTPESGSGDFHFGQFGAVPCQANGRVKPIDTVARTYLQIISGKQTFADENDKEHPAVEWLLDTMASGLPSPETGKKGDSPAYHHRVFRVDSEQVLNMLELKPRSGFRYSYAEIVANVGKVKGAKERLEAQGGTNLDEVDRKMRELAGHLSIFQTLQEWKVPNLEEREQQDLGLVPPPTGDSWLGLRDGVRAEDPRAMKFGELLFTYRAGDAAAFNKALDEYKQDLDKSYPVDTATARFETFFNNFAPFYWCSLMYLVIVVVCVKSWMPWTKPWIRPLNAAAFWLTLFTLLVHTWALGARMHIQGRPPVTNLYSSAIFIGWGSVGLCLFLEYLFKNGIANVGAGALGAATLFIAHFLGSEGDTMEMLQAVLDTNFWLATHVVCVTLGYTATFVAGFLGLAFIILGVFTPLLQKDWIKTLGQATYGVLCFATLLSFTGTVLGGIWADQSWGRFWGWDPKENGAVLIVIWNALILHARWAGLVKERGIAVLVVFGNIVTAWSWFGTNQLGVGLHAYGFNKHLATGCAVFWVTQAFLIAAGCLPLKYWWSFNVMKFAPKPFARPSL